MLSVANVTDFLNQCAPLTLAAEWDNVGLLLGGDVPAPVRRIMTCLTITPESAREAIDEGASLLVAHHPIFFRPIKRLTAATSQERMLLGPGERRCRRL